MKEKEPKQFMKDSVAYKIFTVFNYIILTLIGLICVVPLWYILAISLSGKGPVTANLVGLWPKMFTFDNYAYVLSNSEFWTALKVTVLRTVIGTLLTTILTILLAYPLSKDKNDFTGRGLYMALVIFAMLFSGGLIPTYITVTDTFNLKDTIWALTLPCGVQVFSVIMMMNFFRMLPKTLEEAAYIDGASHITTLVRIVLPCSLPIIITVIMFALIQHWNSWFDGLIYNSQPVYYPLQTYLQQFLREPTTSGGLAAQYDNVSETALASANIFIIMLPIVVAYPWMQKYFIKGITLGSVKE